MENKKIKVDFFIDKKTEKICGWRRILNETCRINKNKIDAKFIGFEDIKFKLPYKRYFNYLFVYPNIIKKEQSEDAIKCLAHQELSYLLKLSGFKKTKTIVICCDIIPYLFPANFLNKIFFNFCIKCMKKASVIIAISESSKRDLVHYFNFDKEKIKVVYLGANPRFKQLKIRRTKKTQILEKYRIPEDYSYILYVGTEAKNKNTKRMLEAFQKLEKKYKLFFIKIGAAGSSIARKKTLKIIKRLGIKNIKIIDNITENELVLFYNAADLFIYPSLYEGFGLPVLEAMACGCPVITSNISSLPEVAGNAALMINPYDINSLADAMESVLTDASLRKKMVKKGLQQVKKFSWGKTAKKFIKIYKEAYNGKQRRTVRKPLS